MIWWKKAKKTLSNRNLLARHELLSNRNIKSSEEKEYNEQAFKLADEIEKAHELSKQEAPKEEIAKAFESAEKEKTVLNEIAGIKRCGR